MLYFFLLGESILESPSVIFSQKLKESRGLLVLFFGEAERISGVSSDIFFCMMKKSRGLLVVFGEA